jgi:hypothetical protein
MALWARLAAHTLAIVVAASGSSVSSSAMADSRSGALAPKAVRDEAVDIVQIEGDRAYHLNGSAGLLIYQISDPSNPRLVGRHSIVGWPLGVVVRGSVATILMRWSDARAGGATSPGPALVRAIDVREPAHPTVLGESAIEGDLLDARSTVDSMYVLSESATAQGAHMVVSSLRLDGPNPFAVHTLRREAAAGWLRAVGGRVVLALADAARSGTRVEVFADSGAAGLLMRGSLDVPTTIGRGDRDTSARIDAPDAAHVRILGCRTVVCMTGDMLEIATVDVTDPDRLSVTAVDRVLSPGAGLVTRFDGDRLYLTRLGWLSQGSPSTPVSVVDLSAPWEARGRQQVVEGVIWNLLPMGSRLLAVATRGDADATREQVVLTAVDARGDKTPATPAEAVLGNGWTSSAAQVSSHAIALCAGSLAIPFRTWEQAQVAIRIGIALFDWTSRGLASSGDLPVEGLIERLACVGDRLLAFTDAGLGSIDLGRVRVPRVSRVEPSAPSVFISGR